MVITYEIKSFENLIEIGTTLGKNWFRGHSMLYNNLTPGVFRKQYRSEMHEIFKPTLEFDLVENFKRFAPSLIDKTPDDRDYLSWLFWIQHYGIPTRLLDWTENVLVAAFFAVTSNEDEDGEIWTIYPDHLNKLSKEVGIALRTNRIVQFLSSEPFLNNIEDFTHSLRLNELPEYPLAFIAPTLFPRMLAQMSVFTIHPHPKNSEYTIESVLSNPKDITKYIVPKKLKSEFEKKLSYLGINYRTLFPDLEGLAKSFARDMRYFGWGQPNPPSFK